MLAPIPTRALAVAIAIAVLASASGARAQCPEDAPDDREVTRRLAWIERRFEGFEPAVRTWWSGFVAFQGLLLGIEVALLVSADDDTDRIDPIVSGTGSLLGLTTLFVFFPASIGGGDALRALPRSTPEERLASLRAAERRLRASAASSSDVRNLVNGLTSLAWTEAAALTLLLLDETTGAFMQAAGGVVVSMSRILLHPSGAVDAWTEYVASHPDAGCEDVPAAPGPRVEVLGLGLRVAF